VYATFGVAVLAFIAQQYYAVPAVTAALGISGTVGTTVTAGGVTTTTVIPTITTTLVPQVIAGAIVGGASGGAIAAINGENVGRAISRGAVVGAATGFLNGLARFTRYIELRGSELATGNPAGLSDGGPAGDFVKIGGGRPLSKALLEGKGFRGIFDFIESSGGESRLGGYQDGKGIFLLRSFKYGPTGFVNYLVESFAGTHDFLQHIFFYDSAGSLRALTGVSGFILAQLSPFINITNVAIASPFAVAFAAPGIPAAADALDFSTVRSLQKERNVP
jgi:hypothetical protein